MILHHTFKDQLNLPDSTIKEIEFFQQSSFEDRNIQTYANYNFSGYANRILTKQGQSYPSTKTERTSLSSQSHDWVRNNICRDFTECSYSITPAISQSHGPHTDVTRLWLLMYIIDAGGDETTNCFWQQKGQEILRSGNSPITVCDYSELKLLSEIKFPTNTWVILNTKVLHSVENIVRPRISIHIGLNDLTSLNDSFLDSLNKESQQTLDYALFL